MAAPVVSANEIEPFMKKCEGLISKQWQTHSLDEYQIPDYFRQHAKGVVCFEVDSKGNAKRIKIKHASAESLVMAARVKYGARAAGLMNAMDKAMIAAIGEASPFPPPPHQLTSHKQYAVVFDTQRLKPLKMFVDDQIPVAQPILYTW